jgi:hypothetical protein
MRGNTYTTYISYGSYRIALTPDPEFQLNSFRPRSSKTALAGNVIRQTAALHASSATGAWNGLVSLAEKTDLEAIKAASSTATIHHYNKHYLADVQISFGAIQGKLINCTIQVGVIEENV